MAGVPGAAQAHVWAACMRFLLCRALRDKALLPDYSFLVLIYSPGAQHADHCAVVAVLYGPHALCRHQVRSVMACHGM